MNALPRIAPPADGLHQAMAAARHRRLRSAGTTTSLTAAALSVAALALGTPGTQTLLQEPAPERPAVTTIVEGPDGGGAKQSGPVGGTAQSVRPVGTAPRAVGPTVLPTPAAAGAGVVDAGDTSRPRDPVKRYAAGPLTKQENYLAVPGPQCTVNGQAGTVCPSTTVYDSGTLLQLYADLCSTRTEPTALHYPGRNEVDFSVIRDGETLWRWSDWHPDGGAPHALTLNTGGCTSWTLDWKPVDSTGKALPKGRYTLKTTFLAEELSDRRSRSVLFDVG